MVFLWSKPTNSSKMTTNSDQFHCNSYRIPTNSYDLRSNLREIPTEMLCFFVAYSLRFHMFPRFFLLADQPVKKVRKRTSARSIVLKRACTFSQVFHRVAMALSAAWHRCRAGEMAPCEQAKLWGLRQALRKLGETDNQYEWMSQQVRVSRSSHGPGS